MLRDGYTCNCGSGGWTSGILTAGFSNLTFLNCDFENHYYVSSQSQGRGAALHLDFDCTATLFGCRFVGNQTGNFYPIGGGAAYGAGIFAFGDLVVDGCEFIANFAHASAGIAAWGNASVSNSLFARNRALSHPNTAGFNDGGYGAGFLTVGGASNTIVISNSTFVDNNSDKGAGMALYGSRVAELRNCIAYANFADPPEPGEDTIGILKQQLVGNYDIAYSCVQGLLQTEPGEDPPEPDNFPGCIDVNPGLVGIGSQNYQLQPGSACIDAGGKGVVLNQSDVDLVGAARFWDDLATEDSGNGFAPIIDMGCYEFTQSSSTFLSR